MSRISAGGSRIWDALGDAITALAPANSDESHYIVFMSDAQDDSSTNTLQNVIDAATNASVQIYTVGIGDDVNTPTCSSHYQFHRWPVIYPSTNLVGLRP